MILPAAWLVLAAECDVDASLARLAAPDETLLDAYLCLASSEAAAERLADAIQPPPAVAPAPEIPSAEAATALTVGVGDEATRNRQTRALALWLLQRTDRAFDVEYLRLLSPADRRLLSDGIRARRGRKSPSPEHEAVFSRFDWYKPVPDYTDGRLTGLDRGNISLVDKPPEPPKPPPPPPEAAAEKEAKLPSEVVQETPLCGCSASGAPGLGALGLLGAALLVRRRSR